MAFSIDSLLDKYVEVEKAKIGARLAVTGQQQAAGLGAVSAPANPQAKASSYTSGIGFDKRWLIGGTVAVLVLGGAAYALKG